MPLHKMALEDVAIRQPLAWALYDEQGIEVLTLGTFIASEKQAKRLLERGLYRDTERETPSDVTTQINVFDEIDNLCGLLKRCFYAFIQAQGSPTTLVTAIASRIQDMVEYDADALLGAIHLYRDHQSALLQPIYSAALVTMVANSLDHDASTLRSTQIAALMANIACLGYSEKLNKQRTRLTDKQLQCLHQHPEQSVDIIQQAGYTDALSLQAILQHHERNDGSGYPNGLKDSEISDAAKFVAIADTYFAMTGKRGYRGAYVAKDALREIYAEGAGDDQAIYLSFIKELGIFPPGTFVRLENDEIAVVTRRCGSRKVEDSMHPTLKAIVDAHGEPYQTPCLRDSRHTPYQIKETCAFEGELPTELDNLWDFTHHNKVNHHLQ